MDNVPTQINGPASAGRNSGVMPTEHVRHARKKIQPNHIALTILVALVIIMLTIGGLYLYKSTANSAIDSSKYQAVFLTNGQVYFGKMRALNDGYMRLTDVHYLQAKTDSSTNLQDGSDKAVPDKNFNIIKLGEEIHGPNGEMIIREEQILFFENLKDDGQVKMGIEELKEQQLKK